jgi:hypothetical protein
MSPCRNLAKTAEESGLEAGSGHNPSHPPHLIDGYAVLGSQQIAPDVYLSFTV